MGLASRENLIVGNGGEMVGRTILNFEVHERLGAGGMGVVYRATDLRLARPVALKFLPPHLADSPHSLARLRQEASAISVLNHPHIETIYELADVEGQPVLVLEYLPGGTLRAKLTDLQRAADKLPIADILLFSRQIAEGLAHAHRHDIIHRDIKTSNLMFSAEGLVKITDFGLAKLSQPLVHTREGALVGTLGYLAPEQIQGAEADPRSDIFSFGVVMFEMATGRFPFEGPTDAARLAALISSPAPPLRRYRPDAPPGLEDIISNALAKRPQDRYQSVDQVAGDLRRLIQEVTQRSMASTESLYGVRVPRLPARRTLLWAAGIAAPVALLVVSLPRLTRLGRRGPEERKLAILPFRHIGDAAASEAFSLGLMDILITKLTQLEQFQGTLRVFSASDVLSQKVSSPGEARKALGANLALSVTVHQQGDRFTLNANLVDTGSQLQLAAKTIEVERRELASLQESLVQAAADILDLELRPEVHAALQAGLTPIPSAYEHYVAGRGELQRHDRIERIENAIAMFRLALDKDPRYALAHAGIAEASILRYRLTREPGHLDDAKSHCARAIEINDSLAPVHVTMGLVHTATGQYSKAVDSFRRALALEPVLPDAYRGLASAYEAQEKPDEAEQTYRRAIQLRPNYWAAHRDLGRFYFYQNRFQEAIPCFSRMIDLTPDNYQGYNNLGAVYLKLGRDEDAAAMFEWSLKIHPDPAMYSNLGTLRYFQGRFPEAAGLYERAVSLNPKDARLWGNLGDARRQIPGQAAKASEAYQRAIERADQELTANPRNAQLRANLAMYLSSIGQRQRSLAEIDRAARLAPADGFVLFRAALVYEQSSLRDRALATLTAAIRSGYSLQEIRAAPTLAGLRKDPRYQNLELAATK